MPRAQILQAAGSPVELNLMARDFVNLRPARELDAALVLVADIDRGGVFAQVVGTLELLPPEDRVRVIGIVVNRFRGDATLFEDGIGIMEARTGLPVLALVPHLEHGLDEEDRPFRIPVDQRGPVGKLKVGAVLYPRVSNTEDLAPLLAEPDLHLTWVTKPELAHDLDLIVLPGSKATVGDLVQLTASGMTEALREAAARGAWTLGICGGYQMLGRELIDPEGGEALAEGGAETGWRQGRAAGAYLHGLLASDPWRSAFLNQVRRDRGFPEQPIHAADPLEQRIQRWAEHLKRHLRPGAWERILKAAQG